MPYQAQGPSVFPPNILSHDRRRWEGCWPQRAQIIKLQTGAQVAQDGHGKAASDRKKWAAASRMCYKLYVYISTAYVPHLFKNVSPTVPNRADVRNKQKATKSVCVVLLWFNMSTITSDTV